MEQPILVLKIGSSTITGGTPRISRGFLENLAQQFQRLRTDYQIILVSSGAVAAARRFVQSARWKDRVASKQALSAIGQPKLMQVYYEVFSDYDLPIAQCLLTYTDFERPTSRTNTLNTISELLHQGYVPIINENDTVAVEELIVGDNDKLSALVAILVKAEVLVLASDVNGLYNKNPHVHADAQLLQHISDINAARRYVDEKPNDFGTGGMTSKLAAAELCAQAHIDTIITNGGVPDFLVRTLRGELTATRFSMTSI